MVSTPVTSTTFGVTLPQSPRRDTTWCVEGAGIARSDVLRHSSRNIENRKIENRKYTAKPKEIY